MLPYGLRTMLQSACGSVFFVAYSSFSLDCILTILSESFHVLETFEKVNCQIFLNLPICYCKCHLWTDVTCITSHVTRVTAYPLYEWLLLQWHSYWLWSLPTRRRLLFKITTRTMSAFIDEITSHRCRNHIQNYLGYLPVTLNKHTWLTFNQYIPFSVTNNTYSYAVFAILYITTVTDFHELNHCNSDLLFAIHSYSCYSSDKKCLRHKNIV